MARTSKPEVEEGSGNVFADLGLAKPDQERLKAHLTLEIYKILKEQGLRQIEAAKLLGTSQPRVCGIKAVPHMWPLAKARQLAQFASDTARNGQISARS